MDERHGNEFRAQKLEWPLNYAEFDAGDAAQLRAFLKDVRKRPAEDLKGCQVSINGKRGFLPHAEWAHVIKTLNMVGVAMGEQYRL
jgi:hypothetical protein